MKKKLEYQLSSDYEMNFSSDDGNSNKENDRHKTGKRGNNGGRGYISVIILALVFVVVVALMLYFFAWWKFRDGVNLCIEHRNTVLRIQNCPFLVNRTSTHYIAVVCQSLVVYR